jgi:hypothetical protein
MAKKLAPIKKNVAPKNHDEVQSSYVVEKSNYGTKETIKEKGTESENDVNPAGALPEGKSTVGLSKGITINLGNYESARINCWISRTVNEDEKSVMDALADISTMIDEQIEFESQEIIDSMKDEK